MIIKELYEERKLLLDLVSRKNQNWRIGKKKIEITLILKEDIEGKGNEDDFLEQNSETENCFQTKREFEVKIVLPLNYPKNKRITSVKITPLDETSKIECSSACKSLSKEVFDYSKTSTANHLILEIVEYAFEVLFSEDINWEDYLDQNTRQTLIPDSPKESLNLIDFIENSNKDFQKEEDIEDHKISKKGKIVFIEDKSFFEKKTKEEKKKKKKEVEEINFSLEIRNCNKINSSKISKKGKFQILIHEPNRKEFFKEKKKLKGSKIKFRGKKIEIAELTRYQGECYKHLHKMIFKEIPYFKTTSSSDQNEVFQRTNYAICTTGRNYIYMFGGNQHSGTGAKNDLVRINIKSNKIDIFKNLQNYTLQMYDTSKYGYEDHNDTDIDRLYIPPMSHHKILPYSKTGKAGILILSSREKKNSRNSMCLYYISNVESDRPYYGIQGTLTTRVYRVGTGYIDSPFFACRHPSKDRMSGNGVPTLRNFSAVVIGNDIWIFGGVIVRSGKFNDTVYCIQWNKKMTYSTSTYKKENSLKIDVTRTWPSGRENFAVATVFQNMYIYGGEGKNGVLNDLYCFDTSSLLWQEIEILGIPPPFISQFAYFQVNTYDLVIMGGRKPLSIFEEIEKERKENKKSTEVTGYNDSLYSLNLKTQKFSLLDTDIESNAISRKGNSIVILENNAFVIGGRKNNYVCNDAYFIEDCSDSGSQIELFQFLNQQRQKEQFCDICFLFIDKKNDHSYLTLFAHLCIIQARSPKLAELISTKAVDTKPEFFEEIENKNDERSQSRIKMKYLEISGFSISTFSHFLNFVYSGDIKIKEKENLLKFFDICKTFLPKRTIDPIILKERKDLDTCADVYKGLKNDFAKLLKEKIDSDVELEFADGEILNVHKLFLTRSKYFQRMLNSDFKEAIENKINFARFNKDAVLDILQYLYTDRLEMTNENCVGVLIYSMQFELPKISNYCRRIVKDHLDIPSAISLVKIADLYNDKVLIGICSRYLFQTYDESTNSPEYKTISWSIRDEIEKKYKRKIIKLQKKGKF